MSETTKDETLTGTILPVETPPKRRLTALLAGDLRALPVLLALALLVIFFATQSDVFLSSRNLSNLLVQTVVTGVLALGIVFVLLLGEIDLSVASISGLCAVLMAKLAVESGLSPWIAVPLPILLGAAIGALTGFWSTRFLVPTFVITLGLGLVLNGIQLAVLPTSGNIALLGTGIEAIAGTYVSGVWSYLVLLVAIVAFVGLKWSDHARRAAHDLPSSLSKTVITPGAIFVVVCTLLVVILNFNQGIPVPVIIFAALLGLGTYVLSSTRFGVHVYATGGNKEAARRAGINTRNVTMLCFALAGGLAALAGVIAASRILGVSVSSGGGIGGGALLLNSIAAAVIGGVSLFGGRGRASAALLGALIIGVVSNGLNLMGVSSDVQLIVTGLLLVGAVTIDRTVERLSGPGQ
ncbi:sugar ABC transporter permease [Microbacterium sp. No. 7]|uniref:sugar ABC transporter permease n=1 Tax=Microbacterium sp. No. 7 TaxID=1714373 RepID=UPI0006D1DEC6|nr:ABC transporter permease [Microbacterium sp. No. 7]ALJ21763.1 ABC transporter permease [Microbacterium sp. No. 7]